MTVARDTEGGAYETAKGILNIRRLKDGVPDKVDHSISYNTFEQAVRGAEHLKKVWSGIEGAIQDVEIITETQEETG